MSSRRPDRVEPGEQHGDVVADMFRCERDLTLMLGRVRERLDAELVAVRADRSPIKQLAFSVQQALGLPTDAAELERVSRLLRQRTTMAHRRAIASSAGTSALAPVRDKQQDGDMTHDPYLRKRRIIEEEFGPPPMDLGDPEELNGAADDGFGGDEPEHDRDHDLGDEQGDR